MAWTRAALGLIVAGAMALALVSGGSPADPRTPAALPGMPVPFLGTAVAGGGGLTAAVDAYGNVIDLRAPGPAGRALIDNPADRQAAGTVAPKTGIVPRVRVGGGPALPLWRADRVEQRYRPGTNVIVTEARFGKIPIRVVYAASGDRLACLRQAPARVAVVLASSAPAASPRLRCDNDIARRIVNAAARADRRWLARARQLGPGAPAWARQMYGRSLLTLRALTDRRTGAAAAGARDGWAFVWPRDAGTAALAFAAAGYRSEARRIARFLLGLDLDAAARFHGDGTPVPGREAQGDASGWISAAARAAGLPPPTQSLSWRDRADYQEGEPGAYLGNAIAASGTEPPADVGAAFGARRGLVRRIGDPGSGLDSAAAWAVRPFARPALFSAVRRTLLRLSADGTRFGITPGEAWAGVDPWSAPTAWSAWGLAALAGHAADGGASAGRDRRAALRLLAALRRAATPAGALPERVDARTGIPTSTTPLAWSHAFTILALCELWP